MKIILRGRRQGKTTEIIKMCHEENGYIACRNMEEVKRVADYAKKLGIDINFPITFRELREGLRGAYPGRRIFIDEVEAFLNSFVCPSHSIAAVTLTSPEEILRGELPRDPKPDYE